jgi:hypothetical protein
MTKPIADEAEDTNPTADPDPSIYSIPDAILSLTRARPGPPRGGYLNPDEFKESAMAEAKVSSPEAFQFLRTASDKVWDILYEDWCERAGRASTGPVNQQEVFSAIILELANIPKERDSTLPEWFVARLLTAGLSPVFEGEIAKAAAARIGTKPEYIGALRKARAGIGERTGAPSEVDTLLKMATKLSLIKFEDNGYAVFTEAGSEVKKTFPVQSRAMTKWLTHAYFIETGRGPSKEALNCAINTIEAEADCKESETPVYFRVARVESKIFIDLCDDSWSVVEIDADGWRVTEKPPVHFRRKPGMRPLPVPIPGGTIDALKDLINLSSTEEGGEQDKLVLVVGYTLGALGGESPFAILALSGEQGSTKTSCTKVLRDLIDPNCKKTNAIPANEGDLAVAAENNYCMAFDNLSGITPKMADAMCRLNCGGGFGTRKHYTGRDEESFYEARPIMMNGIADIVTRADLADRAIFLHMEKISSKKRKREKTLNAEFKKAAPGVFGALCDGLSTGLRRIDSLNPDELPRMADFAIWATACETAYWPEGTFMKAYLKNRDEAEEMVLEADPVGQAIIKMMHDEPIVKDEWHGAGYENQPKPVPLPVTNGLWRGTAEDLLAALVPYANTKSQFWPELSSALGTKVRKISPALRNAGFSVTTGIRSEGKRFIEIRDLNFTPAKASVGISDLGAARIIKDSKKQVNPFADVAKTVVAA